MKTSNLHRMGVKFFIGLALSLALILLAPPKPAHALLPGCILQGTDETYQALGYPFDLFESIVLDFIATQEASICNDQTALKSAVSGVLTRLRTSNPDVFAPGGWLYGYRRIAEFQRDLQRNACNTDASQCELRTPPVCP